MEVVLLAIENSGQAELARVARELFLKGFDTQSALTVFDAKDAEAALNSVQSEASAIILIGETHSLKARLCEEYELGDENIADIDGTIYAFVPLNDKDFIANTLIPALNSKVSTFYDSFIIKTFSKTAYELKNILKELIKNRNKIVFAFYESVGECDVCIRYSSKMSRTAVDNIINQAIALTADCAYAYSDIALHEALASRLIEKGLTLSIAESFTGGSIASKLISVAGISQVLKESIVAYSNEAKIRRLNVKKEILDTNGAVSVETAYAMAANVLIQSGSDFCLASTGNAGPTSERANECGLFYIAMGNRSGIHVFKYQINGDRSFVTEYGTKAAIYRLLKALN